MDKVKVNVSGKETLSWPPFCVLCLKPDPEEKYEASCGEVGWSVPYCRDCYTKVTRFQGWGEDLALISAGWIGFIAGVLFLVDKIRSEGLEVLLCLDGDVWGMAILVGGMAAFAVWLAITLTAGIVQPRLPSLFPNKFARPGADVKTGTRAKVFYPAADTKVETEEIILEEVEFTNPKYAEKFRKANGLSVSSGEK